MKTLMHKIRNRLRMLASGPSRFYFAHPWALGRGIVAGPFTGTRMSIRTSWNAPICLFVGAYEKELHPIWNELNPPQGMTAWVIGAAEGYYACGFAKKWNAKVSAYETSDYSRRVLLKNIGLNGVQKNVEVFGRCESADFETRIKHEAPDLILCDIEGGEDILFTDEILDSLSKTILVIELHPPYGLRAKVEPLLQTHEVQIIDPVERSVSDYPFQDAIPEPIKLRWLHEGRPFSTPWLVAFPKK